MIRNFITIAYRSMRRQWTYSLINIIGLAIGIACSLVIFLFVYGEWSHDRAFAKGDRIYRIGVSFFNIGKFANAPERLLDVLPGSFGGIETATRIRKERGVPISVGDKDFSEPTVYHADTAFFKLFDFRFVAGDPSRVLESPDEVVLTESIARKYFGKTDVLGEVIEVGKEKVPYRVTGVVEDPSFNTHLNSPVWLSIQSQLSGEKAWSSAAFHSYILLREGQSEADLLSAINQMTEKTVFPEFGTPMGMKTLEDYQNNENAVKFYVHPLRDIYLKSKLNAELSPGGNESNIYIFTAISFAILVLAAVNFINLTTARSARRAREVGIRKTMGTSRGKLIGQFLLESVIMSTTAMALSLVLAELFLILFEAITGSPLLGSIWRNPSTVLLFLVFSVGVGVLSGLYPAFYLTSFEPVKVLKGKLLSAGRGTFRSTLVVFQFSVSIILIVCTIVVRQQMQYLQTKDLGFNQENVVTIDDCDELGNHAKSFKDELDKQAGVVGSSYHMGEPGSKRILSFYTYQTPAMPNSMTINTYFGDTDYIPVMGIRLIKGRGFDPNLASDSASVIFNESAIAALDLGENPIGATINEKQKVIGVMSDFHWESLRSKIAPLAIVLSDRNSQLGYKLRPESVSSFLAVAEAKWKTLAPDEPFRYHFLDTNFGELLAKERVFANSINIFTALAIIISCLGLFGLSAFTAEQRTKEIGIRKVMGATASNIVVLLNRKFTRLVLLAVLISLPAAYFISYRWLEEFAYRSNVGPGVFALSVALALLVAWVTVSYHSLRASWLNPSDTLRYE